MSKEKTKLKKKLWALVSKYIRLKNSDSFGYCTCVTCGKRKPWKSMQAGHLVDGRNNAVLFNETLIHPQCYACNCMLSGNKVKYVLYMMKKGYSQLQIEEMENLKHATVKFSEQDLLDMIKDYKERVETYEKESPI